MGGRGYVEEEDPDNDSELSTPKQRRAAGLLLEQRLRKVLELMQDSEAHAMVCLASIMLKQRLCQTLKQRGVPDKSTLATLEKLRDNLDGIRTEELSPALIAPARTPLDCASEPQQEISDDDADGGRHHRCCNGQGDGGAATRQAHFPPHLFR